jgi:membrane fusion protein, multidrug efflux system
MRVKSGIWLGGAIGVSAAALTLLASVWSSQAPVPPQKIPSLTVDVARVISRPIRERHIYNGQLEAVQHVAVRPLVSGTITGVYFRDGQIVEKGSLLFTIDPLPYQAALDRAAAMRAEAAAHAEYSRSQLARAQRLLNSNAISREEADTRQNAVSEANANLLAAEAALAMARLDLVHARVTAPIRGRVSRALITVGNVVNTTGSEASTLTTLVSVTPIYAGFGVDEATYLQMATSSGFADAEVLLGLGPESSFSRSGRIHDVDNRLDTTSGTVRVRAVFDNPGGELLPGLLARIRLSVGTSRPGFLVSDAAIGTDQEKKYVLIVDGENRAQYREVTIGAQEDGLRIVATGLQNGDRVVIDGAQRAKAGDRVSPVLTQMPQFGTAQAGATTSSRSQGP